MKKLLLSFAVLALLSGCAQIAVRTQPRLNLATLRRPFVIHLLSDGRGVDRLIAQELRARGYDADYGARTEMPDNADAALIYDGNWSTDFATYLFGLDVEVRTPRTDVALAVGSYQKPSLGYRPETVAVDAVIDRLFPKKSPAYPPLPPRSDMPDLPH